MPNATYKASVQITGVGFGAGGVPFITETEQTSPTNSNAPPPDNYTIASGLTAILMPPATFTFTKMMLMAPAGSTITKTVTASDGVSVAGSWTTGSITWPVTPGGTFYLNATGAETLIAAFF